MTSESRVGGAAVDEIDAPRVWIVEDEPAAAALAVDLCTARGAQTAVFRDPALFLDGLRDAELPDAVIFDWRLERQLSAALFLAVRHRAPELPVVYWTGSPSDDLPAMIRRDGHTAIVDKAAGSDAFEAALDRALARQG